MNGDLLELLIEDVHEYPGNPRVGDVEAIAASLRANGQFAPLVVRRSDHVVLSGNHTLLAARSLGWATVDAWVIDADEDRSRRIVLAANRTASLGSYDQQALADLLLSAEDDLDGTGYSGDDLDDLLASLEEKPPPAGPAHAMPTPTSPGQRMLVLDFSVDGYLWAQDGLREVCERNGVDTNVAAVVELLLAELGPDVAPLPEGL